VRLLSSPHSARGRNDEERARRQSPPRGRVDGEEGAAGRDGSDRDPRPPSDGFPEQRVREKRGSDHLEVEKERRRGRRRTGQPEKEEDRCGDSPGGDGSSEPRYVLPLQARLAARQSSPPRHEGKDPKGGAGAKVEEPREGDRIDARKEKFRQRGADSKEERRDDRVDHGIPSLGPTAGRTAACRDQVFAATSSRT